MKWIVWLVDGLRRKNIEVELHWVPAHVGIEGNEKADIAAKQATGWRLRDQQDRQKEVDTDQTASQAQLVRTLKSAVKTTVNKKMRQQWAEEWRDCSKGRALYSIIAEPSKSVLQVHDKLVARVDVTGRWSSMCSSSAAS